MNKKIISYGIVALLIITSLVSAVSYNEVQRINSLSYDELVQQNIQLKQQLENERALSIKTFTGMINRCIFIDYSKQYLVINKEQNIQDLFNPTIRRSSSVRTIVETETEYIQCEACVWRGCRIPTEIQVGTTEEDDCGCTYAICEPNPNPIPPNPNPTPHIKPINVLKI